MRWTLSQITDATGGALESGPGGPGLCLPGVSVDSRELRPGELFVALRAERDGHDFVPVAVSAGAAAVMVERSAWVAGAEPVAGGAPRGGGSDPAVVVVGDTSEALLALGHAARRRLAGPAVGITGSVGKTSTKDMAAAALAAGRRVAASAASFNNEIGVPLTLVNAREDAEVAVLEMGARGPGHIALLCRVAEPSIGVVTAVAAAHTEMFGGLDAIARAKGELIEALPSTGLAVLNGDDGRVRAMATRGPAPAVLYSTSTPASPGAEVIAESIELDDDLRPRFVVRSPWGSAAVELEARGAHQVGNALAALIVAAHENVDLEAAASALRHAPLSPLRMELRRSRSGVVVLNDSYNANPASMAAALRALAAVPARRRVAVLGLMAELGETATAEHRAVTALAARLGVEVIAVGTPDYGPAPLDPAAVVDRLGDLGPGDAVLVKASRVAALEKVATRLLES